MSRQSLSSWHWIEPARVERVASRDPSRSEPGAPHEPVLLERLDCIRRTRRIVSTRPWKEGRHHRLVRLDDANRRTCASRAHRLTPARPRARASDESSSAVLAVTASGRAITATWYPGHGPPARRTASRSTRLARLRRTAPPMLRPAMIITRPPGSASHAMTVRKWLRPALPSANSRSMSAFLVSVRRTASTASPSASGRRRRQDLPALAASCGQDGPPALRRHPGPESVGLRPLAVVGLIRTLHFNPPITPSSWLAR